MILGALTGLGQARPVGALSALERAVGAEHVQAADAARDRYARTTAHDGTRPLAVVQPASSEEVQAVVRVAQRFGLSLHAISRGKNWGYGDACAPQPGQVIVDLRRMNRIVEINERLAYAVIEPGVTQAELSQALEGTGLMCDVTGAGGGASIVGNVLERGFGHTPYGDRFLNTCGMNVVLPDGRLLRTGFGHYEGSRTTHVHRYGVGPFLDGLFTQSALGIVTQVGVWLMPRPEAFRAFFIQAPEASDLEDLIETLGPLRLAGVLKSAVHIGNDLRTLSTKIRYPWERAKNVTPLPDDLRRELREELGLGAWNVCGALYGSWDEVRAGQRALKRAVRGRFRVVFLDPGRLKVLQWARWLLGPFGKRFGEQLDAVGPLFKILQGVPSDDYLKGVAWRVRGPLSDEPQDPLDVHAGLDWVSPVLPTTGADARTLLDLLEPIYERYGFEAQVTFTMITARAMCCVTNLSFDKRELEEAARAKQCSAELKRVLIANGFIPYRNGLDATPLAQNSEVFWDVSHALKTALDPMGVLGPGRYQPPREAPPARLPAPRKHSPSERLELVSV